MAFQNLMLRSGKCKLTAALVTKLDPRLCKENILIGEVNPHIYGFNYIVKLL